MALSEAVGSPTRSALDQFRAALSLSDDVLVKFNDWAKKNIDVILGDAPPPSNVWQAMGMSKHEFFAGMALIGSFVFSGSPDASPTPEEFADFLTRRGLRESREKVVRILGGLSFDQHQVEFAKQRTIAIQSVACTLDDVDVHCDLRSIFRHFPAPDTSDSHAKAVRQFLGLEPVFLVSLTLNDSRGSDSVHVFQAGEAGLRSIIRTLQDSLAQLEVIREKFPMVGKSMGGK